MSIGRKIVWAWKSGDIDTKAQMTVKVKPAWELGYYIILCGKCGRPAKVLSGPFPYYQGCYRCEAHRHDEAT